jgi:hypothetical protein
MNLRHWTIFNGAPTAQASLRHCYRRPKEKPMAQPRSLGRKIPTRRHAQIAPHRRIAHAADVQSYHWLNDRDVLIGKAPLVVVRMSLAAEIANRMAA